YDINKYGDTDLAGDMRIDGDAIDLGVYEYQDDAMNPISPSADNILYVNKSVDQSAPGYTGSGASWADAIPELADALQWAREQHDGDNDWLENDSLRIWVARGTYLPLYHAADGQYTSDGNRDNSFVMVKNVQLYGGFPSSENPGWTDRDWEYN